MTVYENPRIWMILDHPTQFAAALALAAYWGRERYTINLLVSQHSYWTKVNIELYRQHFHQIHFMERPDYTWHPVRVIRWLWQILSLKRKVKRLGIGRDDVIIGLSIFHYLENIVVSMHPLNYKICVTDSVVYDECKRDLSTKDYFTPPEGFIAAWLIEPLCGLHRTYCKKNKETPDSYWCLRYRKSLLDIYNKVIIMDNAAAAGEHTGENVYYMPFPYILALPDKPPGNTGESVKKKVVFFDDFFGGGLWGLEPERYARYLNECLGYLRKNYGATHRLTYRPHPGETGDEMKYLDLSQFEIEKDGTLSEFYFYENAAVIDSVFSVASVSSRSAFYFFINSYAFFKIFPFSRAATDYFKAVMGQVPDAFYLQDLTRTPPRYIKTENKAETIKVCQNVLDMVLQKE